MPKYAFSAHDICSIVSSLEKKQLVRDEDKIFVQIQLQKLCENRQEHIIERLSSAITGNSKELSSLVRDLLNIDVDRVRSAYVDNVLADKDSPESKKHEDKIEPIPLLEERDPAWYTEDSNGCFDIQLPTHYSLFELQAQRLLKVMTLAHERFPKYKRVHVPWYILVSDATANETLSFFKEHNFFGLPKEDVVFFKQGKIPCVNEEGRILMSTPYSIARSPNGNGGLYEALAVGPYLDDMERRGILHVCAFSVDNVLVQPVDPWVIGAASMKHARAALKVVQKTRPDEKVGMVVLRNGKPAVIEYSELGPDMANEVEEVQGEQVLRFRAANIAYHYFRRSFLDQVARSDIRLPLHIAHKKIPYYDFDENKHVEPTSPNGYKFEMFIFDVLPFLRRDNFICLEVNRDDEFSPLKNGLNAKTENAKTCLESLYALSEKWILENGGTLAEKPIFIPPNVSLRGEGLEWLKGKNCVQKDFL
ncbi:UDP-N-acetylglucosamine diphosphorylase Uap1/Qri1 [Schizosaccharomyces japonicus yFS275]|uniref:UDP-N-acetylglucosamine diphosphorylase n=1 Tax=Schizosaccharomyces japonicus (strain yFS275 / FY16936) TaxID=402676 RepID=B6JXY3_SCHJY|nr:UDP-N-acetylglucosamine diphosphorylase Uap1/Qri1 [Schizosaccharomyces japonicus yFS275]EEB06401.1 UDP-N-acetylglucosamine diphosphorylase Uap1/Qri1 [Schizosaccharomyces japonicus yFS275]